MKIWDFVPDIEKSKSVNGHLSKFIFLFDSVIDHMKAYAISKFTRVPSSIISTDLSVALTDKGIENFEVSDLNKRTLIRLAPQINSTRGTFHCIRFLSSIVLGYDVGFLVSPIKKYDFSNDIGSLGYDPDNQFMDNNINTLNDVNSYGYDVVNSQAHVTYSIMNYDSDANKLEVFKYLIKKYSMPVEYNIVT